MNNTNINKINRVVVTVNVLIFSIIDDELRLILVRRVKEPFKDEWSLPGGVIGVDESLEKAATRILAEKTGVKDVYLEQLFTFGEPNRDPRERRIAVTYFALISNHDLELHPISPNRNLNWFAFNKVPNLALDHSKIVQYGTQRLQNKAGYSNIGFGLLRKKFRLSELQKVYEIILGHKLDKRNFRKRINSFGLLEETGEKEIEGAHRPAKLYKFKNKEIVFFD